jgi:hypothetical protein
MIQRYLGKISGPLLDRIDIHVEVPAVPFKELRDNSPAESSAGIRARADRARSRQPGASTTPACPRARFASSTPSTTPAIELSRWPSGV